jgi:hypothetical protein
MPLLGELAVSSLNLCRFSISTNAQNFVKVFTSLVASRHEQASAAAALALLPVVVVAIQKRRPTWGLSRHDAAITSTTGRSKG